MHACELVHTHAGAHTHTYVLRCGDPKCFICKIEHNPSSCLCCAQEEEGLVTGPSQADMCILGLWLLWFILSSFDLYLAPAGT